MPDAILLFGDSYKQPSVLWRTGFSVPDPVIYVEAEGRGTLLVSPMEFPRAQKQARVDSVRSVEDFGWSEARQRDGQAAADVAVITAVLEEIGAGRVRVEPNFPLDLARALEARDVEVVVDTDLDAGRRHKQPSEVEAIRATQAAAQAGVRRAQELLRGAEVRDGMLYHEGEPLTSKVLITAIELELLRLGCAADGTIAAGGPGSADPHASDTGHLAANQPVILDIFPQDKTTRYFGDVTRTFVVGEPDDTWQRMHATVHEAYKTALSLVRAGAAGRDIHMAVSRVIYDAGFGTLVEGMRREGVPTMHHGTGHGVGLEIHEPPRVADMPGVLEAGDVVTIEPGLYHPDYGGVRIEDTVLVTADGYENLTDLPTGFTPVTRLAGAGVLLTGASRPSGPQPPRSFPRAAPGWSSRPAMRTPSRSSPARCERRVGRPTWWWPTCPRRLR